MEEALEVESATKGLEGSFWGRWTCSISCLHMFIKTHRTVPEKRTKFPVGKSYLKKPSTPTDTVTTDNNALTIAVPSNSPLTVTKAHRCAFC